MNYNIDKLEILAKKISDAGRIIAKNNIQKEYVIENNENEQIAICSDSGYESICIGNTKPGNTDGYMLLYTNNTEKRNSFPPKKIIKELLIKIINKEKLETGEGKAAYYIWNEFGGIEKQLQYFSDFICRF